MGGEARRPAFFEAPFKKSRAALPIDFGFFLLDWSEQGRKAQQRRSGAEPAERSKATVLHAKGLGLAQQNGPARCRAILPWAVGSARPGQRQSGRAGAGGATEGRPEGRRQAEETTRGRAAERGAADHDATRAGPTERTEWGTGK